MMQYKCTVRMFMARELLESNKMLSMDKKITTAECQADSINMVKMLINNPMKAQKKYLQLPTVPIPFLLPLQNTSESDCIQSACCFSAKTGCYHFLPSRFQVRVEGNQPWSSSVLLMPTKDVTPLNTKSLKRMKLDIREITDDTLSILLWSPDDDAAVESAPKGPSLNAKYRYKVFSPELFIEVRRKADNKTLLSTARGPLIASENYFEWSFHLNSIVLMGFDELQLKEGQRILINNEHSTVVPYVLAYGKALLIFFLCLLLLA